MATEALQTATDDQVIEWARNYSKHAYAIRTYRSASGYMLSRGSHRTRPAAAAWLEKHPFGRPLPQSVTLANRCGVWRSKRYRETAAKIREIEKQPKQP